MCVIWLLKGLCLGVGEAHTGGSSLQLSSLLTIHGQHGNAVYKGGQEQESEQCLTTTATNNDETTQDICKE